MQIIRYRAADGRARVGLLTGEGAVRAFPDAGQRLSDLWALRVAELRALLGAVAARGESVEARPPWLAPIDGESEVWAAGVTYKRSEEARREESATPDIYARVYTAERPELFFKANPRRVAGPEAAIAVRADSNWDVPEPELTLVINAHGEIVGYTIGNDVSSRSIEGENPLYLPQAKVYAGSCALGPAIIPAWEIPDPYALSIELTIERNGQLCWQGHSSTADLRRRLDELVAYLFREDEFPAGVFLCTGTALVPEQPFTLQAGDLVSIAISALGRLRNRVVRGQLALKAASADLCC
ncbi:fumarylacetoacetate hydrolase family protein [Thermogemmatispora carboxidivorans]|uniref:fumarylacetoacetate hydrolase family protein n=1 Tax=Thermogemmatispora carboxidivorans TaxID=1382306 RepID=UPI00069B2053|nr:fumarylacetoacetate hydrolase family protein [Thermogemmatispora carboxidivorans]